MKKNNFPWMSYAISGAGIGFPITVLSMILIGGFNQASRELLIWLVASILFGVTSGMFFRKMNMSPIAATVLHFGCCLLIASGACWLCGYAESFLELLGALVPMFSLIYAGVYLAVFIGMKREAEQINRALEQE
jgi:FtsH-binding integral membrane protein